MERTNNTGCTINISDITGDIICKKPGPECDCLITAHCDHEHWYEDEDREGLKFRECEDCGDQVYVSHITPYDDEGC